VSGQSRSQGDFLDFYLSEIGVRPVALYRDALASGPAPMPRPDAPASVSEPSPVKREVEAVPGDLEELARQAADCHRCPLAEGRSHVVFGSGNPHADLVFIGEAPGQEEDRQGLPFVGRAGKLLERMLAALGLSRDQVYIMNTIKCRPPNNRDPKPEEVEACNPWFEQQLALLKPRVICLLGRVAAQTVLQTDAPLGALRGRWHEHDGIPVRVTYHPAYLLRSPAQKAKSWEDLLSLQQRLSKA